MADDVGAAWEAMQEGQRLDELDEWARGHAWREAARTIFWCAIAGGVALAGLGWLALR